MSLKLSRIVGLRIVCALVAALSCVVGNQVELQISFTTLKFDLDYILDNAKIPTIINIEYTDDAIMHLSVVPNLPGRGLRIKFADTLTIQLTNGTIVQKSDAVYADGSLGLPLHQEMLAYILFKPDKFHKVRPAHYILSYTSIEELTKDLRSETTDIKSTKFFMDTKFSWPHFPLGASDTPLEFKPEDERFHLKMPLVGISLHRERQQFQELFNRWHDKLSPIEVFSSSGSTSDDVPPYGFKSLPEVFFDVWYDPKRRRYGSCSGSLRGVEAVRIYEYDQWRREVMQRIPDEDTPVPGSKGERIRKKTLDQDLFIAYHRLNSEAPVYDNVVIDYAGEILLDVRRGKDGDDPHVTATGISINATGKLNNVEAFYDIENLKYSDQVTTSVKFVPKTGATSSFFKYIDWETFVSHMEAVWFAMQGGCTQNGKRVYHFSIFYGEDIKLRYNCADRTLAVVGTLFVLTDIPETTVTEDVLKSAVSKCKNVVYLPCGLVESLCLSSGVMPVAIQQQPERYWWRNTVLVSVRAEVFKSEMATLGKILTEKGNSDDKMLTIGSVLMDDVLLFGMQHGISGKFTLNGGFLQKTVTGYKLLMKLEFNGSNFMTTLGAFVSSSDLRISGKYEPKMFQVKELIIVSDYLTINRLKQYLRAVVIEALKRCSVKKNTLRFKLVRRRKFALGGFCDCYKRELLVEGQFRSLLLKEEGGVAVASSTGLIDDFIYVETGQFLIAGTDNFNEVYAISIPELTDYNAIRREFGGPVHLNENSFVIFKSAEDSL